MLQYAAIAGGLAVLVGAAVAAFLSLKVPFTVPTTSQPSAPCSPQPCANVRGFILWVTDVKVENGEGPRLVMMQVRFRNASASTHAAPEDFSLIDRQKAQTSPIFYDPVCPRWPRTEFNDGDSFGPVSVCFRPASTSPPLGLRWTPDFGPFCCETVIPLE